jgi:hypothetical protein
MIIGAQKCGTTTLYDILDRDTVFVRQVTERFGTAAVAYVPDARVLHLEIDGLAAYFRKIPIYGRSSAGFRELAEKRPLTPGERLRIVQRTLRSGDVSRAGALQLVGLLASGVALSRVGALRGRADRFGISADALLR